MDSLSKKGSSGTLGSQYRYTAPWDVYAMNWSTRGNVDNRFRLALGSFVEGVQNSVHVVQLKLKEGKSTPEFELVTSFQHLYPATKIAWIPDIDGKYKDLIATSGDCIRLWDLGTGQKDGVRMECVLNNHKNPPFNGPITSFDWNEIDPKLLVTASIDRSCTLWDLEVGKVASDITNGSIKQQVLAHEKEVYDVAFSPAGGGRDIITSVSADGSLRLFDLRQSGQTTIIYEQPDHSPLVRHAWSKQQNHVACIAQDSCQVTILDVRFPENPLSILKAHTGPVNALSWAPHASNFIATAGDDCQTLLWDINIGSQTKEALLACPATDPVCQLQWANVHPEWIAICYHNTLEILRL